MGNITICPRNVLPEGSKPLLPLLRSYLGWVNRGDWSPGEGKQHLLSANAGFWARLSPSVLFFACATLLDVVHAIQQPFQLDTLLIQLLMIQHGDCLPPIAAPGLPFNYNYMG